MTDLKKAKGTFAAAPSGAQPYLYDYPIRKGDILQVEASHVHGGGRDGYYCATAEVSGHRVCCPMKPYSPDAIHWVLDGVSYPYPPTDGSDGPARDLWMVQGRYLWDGSDWLPA